MLFTLILCTFIIAVCKYGLLLVLDRHSQSDFPALYAIVICEIILFHNYCSVRQHPSEIILFQCAETFRITSKTYRHHCSSRISSNTLIVAEMILK